MVPVVNVIYWEKRNAPLSKMVGDTADTGVHSGSTQLLTCHHLTWTITKDYNGQWYRWHWSALWLHPAPHLSPPHLNNNMLQYNQTVDPFLGTKAGITKAGLRILSIFGTGSEPKFLAKLQTGSGSDMQ